MKSIANESTVVFVVTLDCVTFRSRTDTAILANITRDGRVDWMERQVPTTDTIKHHLYIS